WAGATGGFHCVRCTLGRGDHPDSDYVTFSFSNGGGQVANFHFLDSIFSGGAAKDSTNLHIQDADHRAAEYFIDWTYTLKLEDASGNALANATVEITDALQRRVFKGITDQSGQISEGLTELHFFNSPAAVNREMDTPHHMSVNFESCRQDFSVTIDRPTVQALKLNCH